ncbi:MAG: hypothetical protein HYZ44_17040 [Bacteroidetes bacterium]|nr:hypothetical protein [Bacteroidota bacterium]
MVEQTPGGYKRNGRRVFGKHAHILMLAATPQQKMKTQLIIFLITLTSATTLLGQDGSNILYGTVDKLDNSYIGDFVHLDFYNNSYRGTTLDTIAIEIEGKSMKFVERRRDNGNNNWFNQQYLESLDKVAGQKIKIVKLRLDKITTDSVFVTSYLEFFTVDKLEKKKEVKNRFSRTIIAAVLVSANSHKRQVK